MPARSPRRRANGTPLSTYLIVTGTWYPARQQLDLQPGFRTEYGDAPHEYFEQDGPQSLLIELRDDRERVVWRALLPTTPLCTDPAPADRWSVAGRVPFPDTTRLVRVISPAGAVLREIKVPNVAPKIAFAGQPGEAATRAEGRVAWKVQSRHDLRLHHMLAYSHDDGETWQPLTVPSTDTDAVVDFSVLPGGRARLAVVTTDGVHTTWTWSDPFDVPIKGCVATILSPADQSVHDGQQVLWLRGQGFDLEHQRPELTLLRWSSPSIGHLGDGPSIGWPDPPDGEHEIVLEAGPEDRRGQAAARIRVVNGAAAPPP